MSAIQQHIQCSATTDCCTISRDASLANLSATIDTTLDQLSAAWPDKNALIKESLIVVALLTLFCGLFTVLAVVAAYILFSKGLRRKAATVMMLMAIIVMWLSAIVYWIMTLVAAAAAYSSLLDVTSWGMIQLNDMQACMHSVLSLDTASKDCYSGTKLSAEFPDTSGEVFDTQTCICAAALTINVVIGDSIVWWRAWVLWPDKRGVRYICIVTIAAMIVLGALDVTVACAPQPATGDSATTGVNVVWKGISWATGFGNYEVYNGNLWGAITVLVSLSTNVIATTLIAYRAWEHPRFVMKYLKESGSSRTQVERVLALLVESGILYCVLWVLIVVYVWSGFPALQSVFYYMSTGCLVPLIGMYPTLVIIVCATCKSYDENFAEAGEQSASIVFNASRSLPHGTLSELLSSSSAGATHEIAVPPRVTNEEEE